MTDNQLRERAEAKYPIDDEFSVQELVIQHERQDAYIAGYKEAIEEMGEGWIKTSDKVPAFRERVLGYCGIYGRQIYTYEFIGEFAGESFGNWHDGKCLGVLPPLYWMPLPAPPSINKGERDIHGFGGNTWD